METIHIVKKDLDSKTKLLKEVKYWPQCFDVLNKHVASLRCWLNQTGPEKLLSFS